MRLLFIENRYKTLFFDPIAKLLEKEGHEVFWMVQNHNFTPKNGKKYIIPYPKKKDVVSKEVDLSEVMTSDRQLNFFNLKSKKHFYYYYDRIRDIFNDCKPDVVFGECTLFHELLAIKIAREKDILFLHPSSCRYPKERFSFYLYDSVVPYKGSLENLNPDTAKEIISSIANRSVKPDYMKKAKSDHVKKIKDKIKIIKGRLAGERYNTPSIYTKYTIEKKKEKNIALWDAKSTKELDSSHFVVLYPLHLQPEANIDVWGRPRRDQTKNIKDIADQLQGNQILYVKPNPKSKYELSEELIKLCSTHKHVRMIHHSVSMDALFNDIDLVITVNGTIAIECICSNKPVLTLIKSLYNTAPNCIYLEDINNLPTFIDTIIKGNYNNITQLQQLDFLNLLNNTSYDGIISDPFYNINCVAKENLNLVKKAIIDILKISHDKENN